MKVVEALAISLAWIASELGIIYNTVDEEDAKVDRLVTTELGDTC